MSGAVKSAEGIVRIVVTDTALMTPNIAVPGHSGSGKSRRTKENSESKQLYITFSTFR